MEDKIVEPPGSHEPTEHAKTPKKAAASGWIGSALEYYDFFIYAQAAALVFPTLFFPSDNPQAAIVQSFATFGVGYVARPIGAFVLGHWGDTHGRKNVLVLCMLLIGASTFGVALLPTYEMVGVWAPILLVILRLIQGFAVGGEIAGASAMIIEHSPFGRRGYYGSFTLQGVQAGQVFAAAIFLPLLSPADRSRVGIRLPGRHDDRLFVRRRSGRSSATTPGISTTAARSIRRSARRSRIRGACTTCTATWPSGCLDQHTTDFYAKCKAAGRREGPAGDPAHGIQPRRPRRLVGRRHPPHPQRRPRRLDRRLEAARPARSRRASGTSPTPSSSASASSARSTSPPTKRKPPSGTNPSRRRSIRTRGSFAFMSLAR